MAIPETCNAAVSASDASGADAREADLRWRQVIGARIRVFREYAGMTCQVLAARVGLSEHQMRAVEAGLLEISRGQLARIAQPLALPMHLLIKDAATALPDFSPEEEAVAREELQMLMRYFNAVEGDDLRQRLLETVMRLADTDTPKV
ncbi:helix-turn-helix domain-containing protein [Ferrovibrio sp.]|uniref:helix-turn-helix domain-containing protein n=1 Tax=Ferrovibrio sp. TaxID=1917215 RepID=UPI0025BD1236|nr:helix-turn-helix domain-containing protein [Ferrovibrio sp.]MBX3454922.1 helix-turn-helix domain-containing protein [Ferrovibrio sp.]